MKTLKQIKNIWLIFLVSAIMIQAQNQGQSGLQKPGKLLPSEAIALMINAVDGNPQIKRIDNTKPYLPRVITSGLSEKEQFYLGEVYFWNLMPKESLEAYKPLMKNKGNLGRVAWKRTMIVLFNGFNNFDLVESQLKEFRKRFKPDPSDRIHLFLQVFSVANRYKYMGDHKKIVELINEEISELKNEGAYLSYRLPIIFMESYKATGKKDEALKMIQNAKDKLVAALEDRKKNTPKSDIRYAVHTQAVVNMETVVTEKLSYSQVNEKYARLIRKLAEGITKIRNER